MSSLKSLSFTTLPKADANPTVERRTRTIARLEEQKVLLNDANYVRKVRSFIKVMAFELRSKTISVLLRVGADMSMALTCLRFDRDQKRSNSRRAKQLSQYHRSTSFPS